MSDASRPPELSLAVEIKPHPAPKFRQPKTADDLRLLRAGRQGGADSSGHFETRRKSRTEDRLRAKGLLSWANWPSDSTLALDTGFSAGEAEALANELLCRQQASGHHRVLLASSASMRLLRVGYCGAVLRTLRKTMPSDVMLVTVTPRKWQIAGNQLSRVDPKKLLGSFRAQLYRLGLDKVDGWLTVFLHGDFEPFSDTWQLHLHILAVGAKGAVLQRLRKLAQYRASPTVRRPIHRSQLNDPIRQLSYFLLQAFWPNRPRLPKATNASLRRTRSRIPEPRHSEWLMWLARQKFTDLVWLHGCHVGRGRLVV